MDADVRELEATSDASADAERRFQREVLEQLPRNFTAQLIHGLMGRTGFALIQAPTFIPTYVYQLSGSSAVVGLARASQALGMFVTPVFGATLIEHRRRVVPMVFGTGAAMRLSVLGLALAGYFLGTHANLVAICVCLGALGFFTGMQSVTFSFLVSKIIPVDRRGALGGVRSAVAGLVASSVGFVGAYLVKIRALGNGYATVFLIAFALAAMGLASLLLVREPESPEVKPQRSFLVAVARGACPLALRRRLPRVRVGARVRRRRAHGHALLLHLRDQTASPAGREPRLGDRRVRHLAERERHGLGPARRSPGFPQRVRVLPAGLGRRRRSC